MNLASFDIFDTTLLRRCGLPSLIFYQLAQQIFNDKSKQDEFISWRATAENRVRLSKGIKHCTFEDIYSICDIDTLGYTPQEIADKELEIEESNLKPNPQVIEIIKQHRRNGYLIAYISDMYLPSSFLKKVLAKYGIWNDNDKLYVSNEYKASKSDGTLYDLVRSELSVTEWKHFGDNKGSDYLMAKKKGIKSFLVDTGFTMFEQSLIKESHNLSNSSDFALLSGLMRFLRLSSGNNAKVVLSANFVSSCYISYVQHILKESVKRGIKRLYFLNRDSYILMKIAEVLPHSDIELKYLFVSRQSLSPSFCNDEIVENNHYQVLLSYLKQEGLFDGTSSALVDVGWWESTRKMINQIMRHNGHPSIFSFYYGCREDILSSIWGQYDVFYRESVYSMWFITFLLESYFSACPYQSVVGYTKSDKKIITLFEQKVNTKEREEIIETNISTCVKLAQLIKEYNIPIESMDFFWNACAFQSYFKYNDPKMDYHPLCIIEDDFKDIVHPLVLKDFLKFLRSRTWSVLFVKESLIITLGYKNYHRFRSLKHTLKKINSIRKSVRVLHFH
jgi:FMN phosphatase YigB (HAD superfamily)